MPDITHARPTFHRELPRDGRGHGPVHMAIKFPGGPRPTHAACGFEIDSATSRSIGSPFRGMIGVLCSDCGDALDRFAEVEEVTRG